MNLESLLLAKLASWYTAPVWRVAYSGGLDSTVLLHLLWRLSQRHKLPRLEAVHVHHGLQQVADDWVEHCRLQCQLRGIAFVGEKVQVAAVASVERAARDARYAVLAGVTGVGELMLLAQHQDDQAETFILRLLRGAGLRGLTAMPESRPLGQGNLLRPLLGCSRAALESYALAHHLSWIDDPSNSDERFSRNYLRGQLMPVMQARWRQSSSLIARAAEHLAHSQGLLDELAAEDLAKAQTPSAWPWLTYPSFALAPLAALSAARQHNALSFWLRDKVQALPDQAHWAGWQAMREAGEGADPVWRLAGGSLRRGAGRIWWLADEVKALNEQAWLQSDKPLSLQGNGCVYLSTALELAGLRVGYRQGGERMQVGSRGSRDLKRLLNESGVPAFVRQRLPLLWQGEDLIAVANLSQLCLLPDGVTEFRWCLEGASVD